MEQIYYSPIGYWRGNSAIDKLSKAAKVSRKEAKSWLQKQAIWQIYLPAPKRIHRPMFDVKQIQFTRPICYSYRTIKFDEKLINTL